MFRTVRKCEKCKGPLLESYLSDFDEAQENYTQFFIIYCPYCVKLGQEIPVIVWGHTVRKEKLNHKPKPKFKVSRSKISSKRIKK